jgi:serine/threonine-protein kinase RsbW
MASVDEALLDEMHHLLAATWQANADVDEVDREVLAISLSEIVTNVVRHGVEASTATIELDVTADRVTAIVRDDGAPIAADVVERATWPDDVFAESGRGIVTAREALDELRYERVGDDNVWTLVRRRTDGGA